jgi:hypothetical protein
MVKPTVLRSVFYWPELKLLRNRESGKMNIRLGRSILGALGLVIALSVTACGETTESIVQPPLSSTVKAQTQLSEEDIIEGAINALDEVRTSRFNMDVTVNMSGEEQGKTSEVGMSMSFDGALDNSNKKMKTDIAVNIAAPNVEPTAVKITMYLVDNAVYYSMEGPGAPPWWMKTEAPAWETMNQNESQLELLKGAQVELLGGEVVQGVDCYVLNVIPDKEQLWQTVVQQLGMAGGDMPDIGPQFIEEALKSFSVKQWIAKGTFFVTRATIDINMAATPNELGSSGTEEAIEIQLSMDLSMRDYNRPVSIVLPPEAEGAIEVPTNKP